MNNSMTKLYSQDGTGRDSYIFYDNGGFYPGNLKLQRRMSMSTFGYNGYSPQRGNATFEKRSFYFADGTGRDTYVINNIKNKSVIPQEFQCQLRNYESQYIQPQYKYKLPPLIQAKQRRKSNNQKDLITRLSKPKLTTLE